jgi:hypothetical protein
LQAKARGLSNENKELQRQLANQQGQCSLMQAEIDTLRAELDRSHLAVRLVLFYPARMCVLTCRLCRIRATASGKGWRTRSTRCGAKSRGYPLCPLSTPRSPTASPSATRSAKCSCLAFFSVSSFLCFCSLWCLSFLGNEQSGLRELRNQNADLQKRLAALGIVNTGLANEIDALRAQAENVRVCCFSLCVSVCLCLSVSLSVSLCLSLSLSFCLAVGLPVLTNFLQDAAQVKEMRNTIRSQQQEIDRLQEEIERLAEQPAVHTHITDRTTVRETNEVCAHAFLTLRGFFFLCRANRMLWCL